MVSNTLTTWNVLTHLVHECKAALIHGKDHKLWRRAKKLVRARQGGRCAVTREKCRIMDCHHLDDASTHPHKVYTLDNLVMVRPDIHRLFHKWMGGTRVPCTRADWRKFVKAYKAATKG